MKQEIYIKYNKVFSLKKERNLPFARTRMKEQYAQWNKPGREWQILLATTYVQAKYVKIKAESRTVDAWGWRGWGRGNREVVKRYKVLINAEISPRNLLYSIRPIVNNTALYTF